MAKRIAVLVSGGGTNLQALINAQGTVLNSGKITSVELTQGFIDRINAVEPQIGALLAVDAELALAAADLRNRAVCQVGDAHHFQHLHGLFYRNQLIFLLFIIKSS